MIRGGGGGGGCGRVAAGRSGSPTTCEGDWGRANGLHWRLPVAARESSQMTTEMLPRLPPPILRSAGNIGGGRAVFSTCAPANSRYRGD